MPSRTNQFDLYPKIVRANTEQEIIIHALDDYRFTADTTYVVKCFSREQRTRQHGEAGTLLDNVVIADDGTLRVRHVFPQEQEHSLIVYRMIDGERRALITLAVYSLEDDLFALRPYKGDLHMHTSRSDGRESPAHVTAACRSIGLDFMAITDHHRYEPSLEAIAAFADAPVDLRIYPGEEVHAPGNPVHIINFGGNFSVNHLHRQAETYQEEVTAIEVTLTGDDLTAAERYQYASCLWCYEKIRQGGGMSIFCHPYWIEADAFNVSEALINRHLREQPFDAFEVIGGYAIHEAEANALQVARYHEERAQGRRLPVVGVSDSHGTEENYLHGWYSTIVFAPSADLADLIDGVKDLRSVAVEVLPGTPMHIHGPFRLVKYAYFLAREVFPQHDRLCAEEGNAMFAYLAGDATALEQLQSMQGNTTALLNRYWGDVC